MLHIQIDPHSGIPVYRQVMDQIRYYVASGVLKMGDRLPSIRELAKTLSVNPSTIVKAYTELQHAGVIELAHGKGVFVSAVKNVVSDQEMQKTLRRLIRQLVMEARQMGASEEDVDKVLKEEWHRKD